VNRLALLLAIFFLLALFFLLPLCGCWSEPSNLTAPDTGSERFLATWELLRYHLLVMDGRFFPNGQPSIGSHLPYDSSALPALLLETMPGEDLVKVAVHMGTRFTVQDPPLPGYRVVKGVDPDPYLDMFGVTVPIGRWLSGGASEAVVPLSLSPSISVGSEVVLAYGPLGEEELEEVGLSGATLPGTSCVLEVVGLHNLTEETIFVQRSCVDELFGVSKVTYLNVRAPDPGAFNEVFGFLSPFLVAGEVFPVHRRVEMDSSPFVSRSPGGDLYVAWRSLDSGDGEVMVGRLEESGGSLIEVERVTDEAGSDNYPCIHWGEGGSLNVLFDSGRSGDYQVWLRERTGEGWSDAVRLTGNGSGSVNVQPSVYDGSGESWLVWVSYENSTRGRIAVGRLLGDSITEVRVLGNNHTAVNNPCIARNGRGELVIYYSFLDAGAGGGAPRTGIGSVTSTDGMDWSSPLVVMEGSVYDAQPFFLLDSSGESWLAWSSLRQTDRGSPARWPNPEVWYRRTIDGEVWSPPRQLTDSWGVDADPCLAEGGDGRIWAVWYSEDGEPFGRLVCSSMGNRDGDGEEGSIPPWQSFTLILVFMAVAIVLLLRFSGDHDEPVGKEARA